MQNTEHHKKKLVFAVVILFITINTSFGQKFGKDSLACVEKLSLYIEDYKLWTEGTGNEATTKNMIDSWRWCFFHCPGASQNIYIHGVKIIKHLISVEKDPEVKSRLIDTLMMVYDQRISLFNKEGMVLGRKGVDLYKLRPESYNEAYEYLKKSVDLQGNKSVVLSWFTISVLSLKGLMPGLMILALLLTHMIR